MTGIFYGWWIVLAAFMIALYVAGTIFFGFTAFLEPIADEFGWSYTMISLIAALRGLNMGIFAPLAGILVDRVGSRKMIVFGTIVMGTGLVSIGHTNSLAWFFMSFLLLSLGAGGCTSVVLMTVVAAWFRRKVGKAMGLVACGFGAGGLLVPMNVWLIDNYSWRTAAIVLGLAMIAVGVPLSFVIRNTPEERGLLPDGDGYAGAESGSVEADVEVNMELRQAVRTKLFWIVNGAEAVRMMVVTSVVMHIMPYMGSLGVPRLKAGLVASAIPLLSIIGRLGFGWLGDIYSKQKVMALAICFMSIGMLFLSYAGNWWTIVLFLVFFAPGFGGNTTLRGAIIRENFGLTSFGKILGITLGISSVTGIVGPVMAGWSYDVIGSYKVVWVVFTVIASISGVVMAFGGRSGDAG